MKYHFYQDRKIIGWERIHFCIEADNDQQAAERLAEIADDVTRHDDTAYFHISDRDFLLDNIRDLTVEENDGQATIETFDRRQHLLFDNADKPFDRNTFNLEGYPD